MFENLSLPKTRHAHAIYTGSSGCTRNRYGGSWSFSGDCISNCYSGTYHVREWVRIPEVTSSMGVLEHYVYAYQTFNGYVEYQYDPAPVCSEDETCKTCPTSWDGCTGTPICDNSNIIKCGCLGSGVTTGSGSSLATASCSNTEQGSQMDSTSMPQAKRQHVVSMVYGPQHQLVLSTNVLQFQRLHHRNLRGQLVLNRELRILPLAHSIVRKDGKSMVVLT